MNRTGVQRLGLGSGADLSALIFAACLLAPGCATQPLAVAPRAVTTGFSPVPEQVAPADAWRQAEAFVAAHPGSGILVGRGESMLPLYPDRTVLIIRTMSMTELARGMTVVFVGDRGLPVAHVLVERTPRGWIAMGAGNREPDRTPVQFGNYLGTVIRAYAPNAAVTSLGMGGPVFQQAALAASDGTSISLARTSAGGSAAQ